MIAHTKGPWQQDGSHIYGPDPQRRIICQMHYNGRGWQEEDADNENLVKAAPDLLAALKILVATGGTTDEEWAPEGAVNAAYAAIKKAEGR